MINQPDYVEFGLFCAKVCNALDMASCGKRWVDLSSSMREAIEQLTT